MALPNFDELQRLKLEQAQKAIAGSLFSPSMMAMGQRSPLEHVIEQVAAAKENDALRRDVQSLRADLQQMLEADARRHEADRDRANQRVGIANLTLNMFEAFEVAMRDLITSINGLPRTDAQATYHPALNSLYNNLQVIHTSLIELRRTIHQDL